MDISPISLDQRTSAENQHIANSDGSAESSASPGVSSSRFPLCLASSSSGFLLCMGPSSSGFPLCTVVSTSGFPLCLASSSSGFPLCTVVSSSGFPLCLVVSSSGNPLCMGPSSSEIAARNSRAGRHDRSPYSHFRLRRSSLHNTNSSQNPPKANH